MTKVTAIVPSLVPFALNPKKGLSAKSRSFANGLFDFLRNFFSSSVESPPGTLEHAFESIWLALSNNGWGASSRLSRDFSIQLIAFEGIQIDFLKHLDAGHSYVCTELLKLIFLKSKLSISTFELKIRTDTFEERLKVAAQTKNFAPQSALFEEVVAQSIVLETDLKRFEVVQMAALNLSHELQRLTEDLEVAIHFPESDLNALVQKRELRLKDLSAGLDRIQVLFGG
jgi:hypothetical protein